ncbi:MAG: hypothetical protein KIC47_12635 [Clostridium sp.]|uniref:hypothetical protein n=1 Tax=Clostridium neonatale TaxID=137838 RepID=UPI001D38D86F|nr:hypothetical protein [Clostridium neonatale]MBS5951139.1 hypothetical protein [Clostridium sp.]CAI3543526.1 conserved hypothetical protein [Clostridium neonatale]
MDELIKAIDKYENGTKLIYEFEDKGKILGETDTIYESDNGLDLDEEGYEEYYVAVVKVISILQHSDVAKDIKVNSLIEIFYKYPISGIELEDGSLIWSRG